MTARRVARQFVVIYDGDCGVCTRMVRALERWDRGGVFEITPSQAAGVSERFPWIDADAYVESLQVVRVADGRTWAGAAAIETIVNAMPRGVWIGWLFRVPFVRTIADRGYRWFARYRHHLGCGTHCRDHDAYAKRRPGA